MSSCNCKVRSDFLDFMNHRAAWPEEKDFQEWLRSTGQRVTNAAYAGILTGKMVKARHLISFVTYLRKPELPPSRQSAAFAEYLRSLGIEKPRDLSYASIVERLLATTSESPQDIVGQSDAAGQASAAHTSSRPNRMG